MSLRLSRNAVEIEKDAVFYVIFFFSSNPCVHRGSSPKCWTQFWRVHSCSSNKPDVNGTGTGLSFMESRNDGLSGASHWSHMSGSRKEFLNVAAALILPQLQCQQRSCPCCSVGMMAFTGFEILFLVASWERKECRYRCYLIWFTLSSM